MTDTNTQPAQQQNNDKTIVIITYVLGLIGVLIAYFMTKENRSKFAAFHMRQILGFGIVAIAVCIVLTIIATIIGILGIAFLAKLFSLLSLVVYLAFFVIWVIALIGALKGEEKLLPVIGAPIQEKLAKVFAA